MRTSGHAYPTPVKPDQFDPNGNPIRFHVSYQQEEEEENANCATYSTRASRIEEQFEVN